MYAAAGPIAPGLPVQFIWYLPFPSIVRTTTPAATVFPIVVDSLLGAAPAGSGVCALEVNGTAVATAQFVVFTAPSSATMTPTPGPAGTATVPAAAGEACDEPNLLGPRGAPEVFLSIVAGSGNGVAGEVYGRSGELVRRLTVERIAGTTARCMWDGTTRGDVNVASGVYEIVLSADDGGKRRVLKRCKVIVQW